MDGEPTPRKYPFGTEALVANLRETHTRLDLHLLIEALQEVAIEKRGDGSMDLRQAKKKS